jgi:hypothetical protein
MRKSTFSRLIVFAFLFVIVLQSCRNDVYLKDAPPVPDGSFHESFDTFTNAYNRGWRFINRSEDIGVSKWQAGSISGALFPYKSLGTNAGFITTDYQATAGVTFQNGDKIVFYTTCQWYAITGDSTDFANRLQLRYNPHNEGLNVGDMEEDGDFDEGLIDINPTYIEGSYVNPQPYAYPNRWTRFEATITGLNKPVKGRFAFRYFTEEAGSNGRGSEVGIDEVSYISASHQ